ncbi:serine hydrolase [bacterium]|jgi:beta-N-acetylhexosaminidase|nr:serine hydrolase [bacterium]MDG1436089.1 serine hydrolase [Saprospiraceae bacterium]
MKIFKRVPLAIICLITGSSFCFSQAGLSGKSLDLKATKSTKLSYDIPTSVGMDSLFLHQKIDSIANEAIEAKAFPGMQVLIAKSGKIVFHKAYGFHTYEDEKNVQLTDLYDFASVSKITTALPALMKLHGEGRFDLDKSLKTYFPKFINSNKSDLNYREILAHQAGLKPWIPYWTTTIKKNGNYKWRTLKNKRTKNYNIKITDNLFLHKKFKKRIYKAIFKSPVSNVKEYKYSGLAFYLFPEIIAEMTNMDFESYLKKEIYEPIGATTLTYNPKRFFSKDRIIPTERDTFFRKIQIHGTVHDEGAIMMGGVSANAGLFGTAIDLAKLMQLFLNGGSYDGRQIIAKESIDEFTKYQFPENNNRRGLGFDKPLLKYNYDESSVAKDASPSSYGHSGYTGTFVWVDPEYELIYIFFSNRVFPTRNNRKIYEMNVRPNIHQIIYDSISK